MASSQTLLHAAIIFQLLQAAGMGDWDTDLSTQLAKIRFHATFWSSILQDVSFGITHMLHIRCPWIYKHSDLPLHASQVEIIPPARTGLSEGGGSRLTFKVPQTVRALFLTEVALNSHQSLTMRALKVKALPPRVDPLLSLEVVGLGMNNSGQQQQLGQSTKNKSRIHLPLQHKAASDYSRCPAARL